MTLEQWGMPLAVTLLSVGVRCSTDPDSASLSGIIRAFLLAVFIGSIVNLYFLDYIMDNGELMSHTKRSAMVGISTGIAQEIYNVVKKAPETFLVNAIKFIFKK